MYKNILLAMLIFGLLLIVINITKTVNQCPSQQIIYKYIPRTFDEEQENPALVSDIFKTMFSRPEPWIGSVNDLDSRKKESINKYFISKM